MEQKFLKNLTLKQLRVLQAVAENGTVSAAAEALEVTPPAVTLQLRLLEELCGLPLLERGKQGFRPTEAGQKILGTTLTIQHLLRECEESLACLSGLERGHISIGVISTAKYFMPKAIAAFLKQHPQIQLSLTVGNRGDTLAGLASPQLDFAIMGRPPQEIAVIAETFGDHPHVFIAAPDHPLAGEANIPLSRLASETALLREPGSGTRMLLRQFLQNQKMEWRGGMEFGSNESIKQGVMAGLGIAFISAHTIAAEVEEGRLVILQVMGTPLLKHWYLVRLQEHRLLPAAQALWNFLKETGPNYFPEQTKRSRTPLKAPRNRLVT